MAAVLRQINTKKWTGKIRFLSVRIISSPDFELLVILLIFGNCISLSMLKPQQGEDSPWNQTLNTVELGLNACFTVEVILRIIAVGGVMVSACPLCNPQALGTPCAPPTRPLPHYQNRPMSTLCGPASVFVAPKWYS